MADKDQEQTPALGRAGAGYDCWLGYRRLDEAVRLEYQKWCSHIVAPDDLGHQNTIFSELLRGVEQMLGVQPDISNEPKSPGSLIIGRFDQSALIDANISEENKRAIGPEGYCLKTLEGPDQNLLIVTARTDRGLLYGTYALLRLMSTQANLAGMIRIENPRNPLRIIDHWDNMDGSVERGYAGRSIFYYANQLTKDFKRLRDYARLLASIGINGVVINNVNVKDYETRLITSEYLPDLAKLAAIFRDFGIRIYFSINYASPIRLGNLPTADPLERAVQEWWARKAAEIYSFIPDCGGFLVKADSEFTPGPFTYGRNHAEGANMLAEALEPFGGLVIWRCFVYNCTQDWRDRTTDRAKAAYDNFKPLDGEFRPNVALQIKNGPMDFQVREPVSPLFGGLTRTNQLLELQITQEYTGQQRHLCYLVPQWKETFDFDTFAAGQGTTVQQIVAGSFYKRPHAGIAGVANIGDDPNWTGYDLAQANLYGFGRLAWNPDLTAREIAEEWVGLTFGNHPRVIRVITEMLLDSWKIYENYTVPLGIGWMVNPGYHYGPNVDGYEYSKWGTYHRADCHGIGIDRTRGTGTGFIGQYHEPNAEIYESLDKCPDELLLFFHHVPYSHRLKSGETVIQHIYNTHFDGVDQVVELRDKWLGLRGLVAEERFTRILQRLEEQLEHAKEWRDVINSYFFRKTGIADELGRKIY